MAGETELLPDPAAMDDSSENARNGAKKRRDPTQPTAVVGIGASAGGIAPLQHFFEEIKTDTGLAFVVVMHLSPDFESQLAEVLQQKTAMPVVQVVAAVKVQPNHVYVIPPNHQLTFEDSMLRLLPPQQALGRRVTIDLFFRTLAHAYGQRAVSIIMSGTDSDGVIGMKHIRAQGGVTIAQEPEEAAFDSMPLSAINTGMVDWVLRVGDMPRRLLEFVRNENAMQLPPEIEGDVAPDAKVEDAPGGETVSNETRDPDDEEALLLVLKHLFAHTGHDFGHYKRATVLRRIARRLQVNSLDSIPRYLDFLRQHPAEARALLHDLLIGVTHFFRDQTSFAALEANIPQLFAGKKRTDELRVWVTGCATGEEAYSITMLLCEQAEKLSDPPSVQVFATDIDEQSINEARHGLYPPTIEADVSQERLRQFFMRDNGRYRVKKEIRDKVLFAQHNVLSDPAFSRVDLVTCRNLLIYLNREAQARVFDVFHFALRSGGLLFIGGAESADSSHSLFAPLDNHHRIYVRRSLPRPTWKIPTLPARVAAPDRRRGDTARPMLPGMTSSAVEDALEHSQASTYEGQGRRSVMFGELHLKLLEEYGPPSVVVNEACDIVHLSESAGRYLAFRAGEPSTNLMTVVNPSLRVELRTALFRAGQSKESVIIPAQRVPVAGETETINLHVRPIRPGDSAQGFFLILFEKKIAALTEAEQVVERETISREVGDELQTLKGQLNATVEQFEASSEELKASNEELQAMNEELRSAAEELETSKEELQSVNEELTTVNHELKDKVEELSHANSDLNNLMTSTDLATIFLDRELRVVRFTPRVQDIFNLLPADMGRPISDITHKLRYDMLIADAEQVLDRLASVEREVETEDARTYLSRIAPYRTLDDKISGVVVTLIDITQIKRAQAEVRAGTERYRTLFDLVPVAVYSTDAEGIIQEFNRRAVELWGRTPERNAEKYCGSFQMFHPDGTVMSHEDCPMAKILRGEKLDPSELEVVVAQKDGARRSVVVSPSTLKNERGEIIGAINCFYDITERKVAEQALVDAAEQREALYEFVHRRHEAKSLGDIYAAGLDAIEAVVNCDRAAIFLFDENGVMQFVDSRGLSAKYREEEGHSPWKAGIKEPLPVFIDDVDRSDFSKALKSRLKVEGIGAAAFLPLMAEEKLIGAFATFYNSAHVFTEQERSLSLTIGGQLALGIERKRAEEALRQTEERFELLVEGAKEYAMFLIDPDNLITFWSSGAERLFGWSRKEAEGQTGALIFTPEDRAKGAVEQEIGTALREGRAPDRRWHLRKDGSRFWTDGVMMRLDHEDGGVRGLVKIARDATDERAAEEALRHAKDEMEQRVLERTRDLVATNSELERTMAQRRQLEKELLEISEREKRRIGQDLHDIVCQELTAAALFLKSSANRSAAKNPEAAKALGEAAEIVNRNVTLARNLARGFQPVKLSGGEFTAAIRALVSQTNKNRSVHCRLEMPQPIELPEEAMALNIYRIAQEALTNAIKHADSKTIVVTLKKSRGTLQLAVEDDGKGFQKKKRSKGLGLHIMDYRASVLGGSFAIESKAGGTRILCTIPLKSRPEKR